MGRITVDFDECELEGDYCPVDGVVATCSECDHQVEAFGRSDCSRRSCLVRMRQECPLGHRNYYVDRDEDDDG